MLGAEKSTMPPQTYCYIDHTTPLSPETVQLNSVKGVLKDDEVAIRYVVDTHNTYGHCGWKKAADLAGVAIPVSWQPFCRICAATRLKRAPKRLVKAEPCPSSKPCEYLHMDLHGKVKDRTQNGMQYYAVVVDDYSSRIFVLLLQKKKHFCAKLEELILKMQADTGHIVGRIKTDGDGIFRSEMMGALSKKYGIEHVPSTPYTSHFNGKAEKTIGLVKEMARSMLFQSGLPRRYWGEAVVYATQVLNRMKRRGTPPPYSCALSAWRGAVMDNPGAILKPFGCEAWAIDNSEMPKNASRRITAQAGTPCIFVGLQSDKGTYRVLSLMHARVFHTVDVIFNISSFPVTIKGNYAANFDTLVKESEFCAEYPDRTGGDEGGIPIISEFDREGQRPEAAMQSVTSTCLPPVLQPFNQPGRLESQQVLSRARERAPSRAFIEQVQNANVAIRGMHAGISHNMHQHQCLQDDGLLGDRVEVAMLGFVIAEACKAAKMSKEYVIKLLNSEYNTASEQCFINSLAAVMHNIPKTQTQLPKPTSQTTERSGSRPKSST